MVRLEREQVQFWIHIIIDHLVDSTDDCQSQLIMCIHGPGGTGKSQVINAVTKYFRLTNSR
jgi:ABC-type branched-subunit amino acid transport system ATPase component